MQDSTSSKVNLANLITLSRVLLSPVFAFVFLTAQTFTERMIALLLAALMEATDLLDGVIARRQNRVSETGKLLDPLADSISRFTVFVCFLVHGYAQLWMLLVIFYRDALVNAIRFFALQKGQVIAARASGKIKAWVQGLGILIILCIWGFLLPTQYYGQIILNLMLIITIYTAWTAFDYAYANRNILKQTIKE